jgi:hypothetical protein
MQHTSMSPKHLLSPLHPPAIGSRADIFPSSGHQQRGAEFSLSIKRTTGGNATSVEEIEIAEISWF